MVRKGLFIGQWAKMIEIYKIFEIDIPEGYSRIDILRGYSPQRYENSNSP